MSVNPLILGFDTSGPYVGVALFRNDDVVAARYENMAKGQAEALMPMLSDVMAEADAAWSDLTALGVGIGPGNFTGIRISVAAARGLALSLGIPAVGVSVLEALAEGSDGPVLALRDAPRDCVYAQIIGQDAEPELLSICTTIQKYAGFDSLVLGNRAAEVATALGARTGPAAYAPASAIARIAARRAGPDTPRPAPLYVRAPDAAPSKVQAPVILPEGARP